MNWLLQLLCIHAWTNRREGPRGRAGSFRIWACGKCGKEIRHAEIPYPRRRGPGTLPPVLTPTPATPPPINEVR